jgi:hypothetical protein
MNLLQTYRWLKILISTQHYFAAADKEAISNSLSIASTVATHTCFKLSFIFHFLYDNNVFSSQMNQ